MVAGHTPLGGDRVASHLVLLAVRPLPAGSSGAGLGQQGSMREHASQLLARWGAGTRRRGSSMVQSAGGTLPSVPGKGSSAAGQPQGPCCERPSAQARGAKAGLDKPCTGLVSRSWLSGASPELCVDGVIIAGQEAGVHEGRCEQQGDGRCRQGCDDGGHRPGLVGPVVRRKEAEVDAWPAPEFGRLLEWRPAWCGGVCDRCGRLAQHQASTLQLRWKAQRMHGAPAKKHFRA